MSFHMDAQIVRIDELNFDFKYKIRNLFYISSHLWNLFCIHHVSEKVYKKSTSMQLILMETILTQQFCIDRLQLWHQIFSFIKVLSKWHALYRNRNMTETFRSHSSW